MASGGGPSVKVRREHATRDRSHKVIESNVRVARNFIIVFLIAVVVWALCSFARYVTFWSTNYFIFPVGSDTASEYMIWVVCGILVLGGIIRAILLSLPVFKGSDGDGVSTALTDFHNTYEDESKGLPKRYSEPTITAALKRCLLTIITVGSGGSGGLEAPVLPIGENIGSWWSKLFKVHSRDDLRAFQVAGLSAAIATLLNAPFMAVIFATEVLFNDRNIYRLFMYGLLSAVVVYILNNHYLHIEPIFSIEPHSQMYSYWEYGQVALVSIVAATPAGLLLIWCFDRLRLYINKVPVFWRPIIGALGCCIVTLIMWFGLGVEPRHMLGIGEETIKDILSGHVDESLSVWWLLLAILVAKVLTTGLTLMSGGSAGLLVPSMIVGGLSASATYHFFVFIGVPTTPTPSLFVVSGVAVALVAIIEVPIAAIAFVLEIFGPEYAPPAIIAVVICQTIVRKRKQY